MVHESSHRMPVLCGTSWGVYRDCGRLCRSQGEQMAQSWPLMIDGSLVGGLGVIKLRIGKPLEPQRGKNTS